MLPNYDKCEACGTLNMPLRHKNVVLTIIIIKYTINPHKVIG